jgi:predicted DNA binding protein
MSVIIELVLRRDAFALGQILPLLGEIEYSLETIVPMGEEPIPFVRVHDGGSQTLIDSVTEHPAVVSMELQTTADGDEIYRLEWEHASDEFLNAVHESGGHMLTGDSYQGEWQFTLQFPDHESVSAFDETLQDADIHGQVMYVHNPWVASQNHRTELTEAQREALALAYRNGYYDIPRTTSTKELADALGISDQALSERLRRGTARLIASAVPRPDSE